jgi:hypothetical protein
MRIDLVLNVSIDDCLQLSTEIGRAMGARYRSSKVAKRRIEMSESEVVSNQKAVQESILAALKK